MTRGDFNSYLTLLTNTKTPEKEQLMLSPSIANREKFSVPTVFPSSAYQIYSSPLFCIIIVLILLCMTLVCMREKFTALNACLSRCYFCGLGHIRHNSMGQLTYLVHIVLTAQIGLLYHHGLLRADTHTSLLRLLPGQSVFMEAVKIP